MSNTAEVAPILSTRESNSWFGLYPWQAVVLFLLTVWLYGKILFHLAHDWLDPNFAHGIFVPIFVAFLIWEDRKRLAQIKITPSWSGLWFVALAIAMAILGTLGAELSLPRASLVILLAGLTILFLGWGFFRALLFPWAFLFLMIPIPVLVMNHITLPLQLLASKLATFLLEVAHVPVLRQGNLIYIAARKDPLEVARACSGIRSMLTLVTLSLIYGYLLESRVWVRVLLVALAFPIAIAANSLRIFGTGMLLQYGYPDLAEGFFHTFEGEIIFAVALVMLFVCHRIIVSVFGAPPKRHERTSFAPATSSFPIRRVANSSLRFAMAVALMLPAAAALQRFSGPECVVVREPLASFPLQIGAWVGHPENIDDESLNILGHPEYALIDYESPIQSDPWVQVYIAYYVSQRAGDTIHSPEHCLPGAGWTPTSKQIVQIQKSDGSTFPLNRDVVEKGSDRILVLYWFQAHGRELASEYKAKYYLMADSVRMKRSDGALVRLMTPMLNGETAAQAQERLMGLGSTVIPMLDSYIPR